MKSKPYNRICIGVQVSECMYDALKNFANKKEITVSTLVRLAVNKYMEEQ